MNPPPSKRQALSSSKSKHKRNDAREWRPWADITTPLLNMVLPSVDFVDRIRLSAVCRSWHDFLADHPSLCRPRFPWLMFQNVSPSICNVSPFICNFCSSSERRYYRIRLAYTKGKVCIAGSHGWLLFSTDRNNHVRGFLINPLSKVCINLPSFPMYFTRAAFSAAPTEPSCMVLGLSWVSPCTWNIHYCSIGGKTWHVQPAEFMLKSNIAVMGGKFYFLCREGLVEMDCSRGYPLKCLKLNDGMLLNLDPHKRDEDEYDYNWLVELNGELLVVTLMKMKEIPKFVAYVHKADLANKIWVKVEDLRGHSLFLSNKACFSLPEVDASKHVGGCIYLAKYKTCRYTIHHWVEFMVHRGRSLDQLSGIVAKNEPYDFNSGLVWFMPTFSSIHRMV